MSKAEQKRIYHSNGQLCCEISYLNGQLHGISRCWCADGQIYSVQYHINGESVIKEEWWAWELIHRLAGIKDE